MRPGIAAGAVAVVLVGAAAVAASGGEVVSSTRAGVTRSPIAFASDRDGVAGIFVVDPDGTHLRRLIANAREPRWSPDGSHITFRRGDDDALFLADVRGHVVRRLLASYGEYAWAPDGTRIVSVAEGGLVVVRVDGSRARLTRGPDVAPSWSPDGSLIAFVRGRGETGALVVIDAERGTERQFASGAAAVRPAWSPDGSRLAFLQSRRPVLLDVKTLAQRGVPGVRVDEYDVDDATLAWSPDGSRLAVGWAGGAIVVPVDGGRSQTIGNAWYPPTWSPDGRRLATSDDTEVVVVRVAGSSTPVTDGRRFGYANREPDWYPRRNGAAVGGEAVAASVPTDSRQIGQVLRTRSTIDSIAADGPRVAIAYTGSTRCIELWTPSSRRLVRFAEGACSASARGGEAQGIRGLGLAGSRVAWTNWMETNHYATWVVSATESTPEPRSVFEVEDVEVVGMPYGDGSLLVFESWRGDRRGVVHRIDGRRVSRVAATTGAPSLLAVGSGLLVRRHDARAVDVVRANGRLVGSFGADGKIVSAAVDRGILAMATAGTLSAYDTTSRRRVAARPIGARERLVDLDGGIAVLVDSPSLRLLRLADGASIRLHVAGPGSLRAQLEPSGLFYSYAAEGPDRGRVVFVPRAGLERRLQRR